MAAIIIRYSVLVCFFFTIMDYYHITQEGPWVAQSDLLTVINSSS